MTRRRVLLGGLLVLVAALAFCCTVPVARAAPSDDPSRAVLAIVSPIAAPACAEAGSATLLVPIVGGLVDSKLGTGNVVSVGDVLLDSLGPVYIVCGTLPAAPGTRCQLDDQIAGVLAQALPATAQQAVASPVLVGAVIDSLAAALHLLGLPPLDALSPALQCNIAAAPKAAEAPPAPKVDAAPTAGGPPVESPSAVPPLPDGGAAAPVVPMPAALSSTASLARTQGRATEGPTQTIVNLVSHHVPGWLLSLQMAVAAFLAAFLVGSWLTAARAARRAA
jgi:hypothetical protein